MKRSHLTNRTWDEWQEAVQKPFGEHRLLTDHYAKNDSGGVVIINTIRLSCWETLGSLAPHRGYEYNATWFPPFTTGQAAKMEFHSQNNGDSAGTKQVFESLNDQV